MTESKKAGRKQDKTENKTIGKRLFERTEAFIGWMDGAPLFWLGLLLFAVTFAPYGVLKGGSVFEIHDQLDETLLTYVLSARHLGGNAEIFPEMLGGIQASGMQPSAVLFIFLYRFLPTLLAFLVQYAICFLGGFFGMYFSVRELTKSSILAAVSAGCFCLLPMQPVYGMSLYGIPLALYAYLCLKKQKRIAVSLLLLVFLGLTSHLVLTGYVMLSFWALALLLLTFQGSRKNLPGNMRRNIAQNKWVWTGFLLLTGIYIIVNHQLFAEFLLGKGSYVSHREELLNAALPFWKTAWEVFLNSAQHAPSLHQYLILPILALLAAEGFGFRKMAKEEHFSYLLAAAGMAVLILTALFYGFCKSAPVAAWKNGQQGFLRYFQMERYYWIYPAGWYLEFACAFGVWWRKQGRRQSKIIKLAVLVVLLLPTLQEIKYQSYFYRNVNQINNGSGITGYVSWDSYYAEDLMQELEDVIGRDMSTYRIAHLGISPAPSLMHGFYTVDGYSNNYSLDYKHRFRKVIERELAGNQETRVYFDTWGSRCYLFNRTTGTYWELEKGNDVKYEELEFDMEALRGLGCEYLFSGGEILHPEKLGLEPMGYYETEEGIWGIWLYRLSVQPSHS